MKQIIATFCITIDDHADPEEVMGKAKDHLERKFYDCQVVEHSEIKTFLVHARGCENQSYTKEIEACDEAEARRIFLMQDDEGSVIDDIDGTCDQVRVIESTDDADDYCQCGDCDECRGQA